MKRIVCYILFTSVLGISIQCQKNTAAIPDFKSPQDMKELHAWHKEGEFWHLQNPESPFSPRVLKAYSGPEFNVYSFDDAFKDLEGDTGIDVKNDPTFEKLEAYEEWDGTDMRISLTPTTYAGVDGVLFLLISKPQKDENYHIIGLEMTQKTYREWGGVARILTLREIIQDPSVFPEKRLEQIANAPLEGQILLYEETLNALRESLLEQMVAMSKMQTVQILQNIQFDIILNSELTSPFEH